MRILVIGGTGFIGEPLVSALRRERHDVTVVHRGGTGTSLPSGVARIQSERAALASRRAALRELRLDVVIDLISYTQRHAEEIVHAIRGLTPRVVVTSSGDVYRAYARLHRKEPGSPDPIPLTEDAPLRESLFPYRGATPRKRSDPSRWLDDYEKILVERVFLAQPDLEATLLRLPMVYGPRDRQHRFFDPIKRMLDGRKVILLEQAWARWRTSWSYVENVAAAIALSAVSPGVGGRVYNVAEATAPCFEEWVQEIGRVLAWTGEVRLLSRDQAPPQLRRMTDALDLGQDLVLASDRIRRELGFQEPVSRVDALRRTVEAERSDPPPVVLPSQFDYASEDRLLRTLDHGT